MTLEEARRDLRRILEDHDRRRAYLSDSTTPPIDRAERGLREMERVADELRDLLFRMDA